MASLWEFLGSCFLIGNVVYTILLILIMLYWGIVMLGALDFDTFDLNLDLDADIDFDADLDLDADADIAGGGSALIGVAHWFYIGTVPLMVVLSLLIIFQWVGVMVAHALFGTGHSVAMAALAFVPVLLAAMLLTKIIGYPLFRLFDAAENANRAERQLDMIGKTCIVITSEVTETFGQAEVSISGPPMKINVNSKNGERLVNGDEAVIVKWDRENSLFTIRKI